MVFCKKFPRIIYFIQHLWFELRLVFPKGLEFPDICLNSLSNHNIVSIFFVYFLCLNIKTYRPYIKQKVIPMRKFIFHNRKIFIDLDRRGGNIGLPTSKKGNIHGELQETFSNFGYYMKIT